VQKEKWDSRSRNKVSATQTPAAGATTEAANNH
jgi:hypothetical protein